MFLKKFNRILFVFFVMFMSTGAVCAQTNTKEPEATGVVLPASFDWRDKGCVTPVKMQSKTCNVCWAFATIGSYESAICVNGGPLVDLSEQYLIDCNTQGYTCASEGFLDFNDMVKGVPLESCYPFECPTDCSQKPCKTDCAQYYPLKSWKFVGSSSGAPSLKVLKTAILTYGPVVGGVSMTDSFINYSGGIFDKCNDCSKVNHVLVIVGWDDAGGYWILKNSFGEGWGEKGYMRIKYGCCSIGYAAAYAIPTICR